MPNRTFQIPETGKIFGKLEKTLKQSGKHADHFKSLVNSQGGEVKHLIKMARLRHGRRALKPRKVHYVH
jgi:hypothetical protein